MALCAVRAGGLKKKSFKCEQLLDEAEHDIKNYPDRGQCYLSKPEADNIDRGLDK